MSWDREGFAEGLREISRNVSSLLLDKYKRKLDYEDWQKQQDYALEQYGKKQEDILERQIGLEREKQKLEDYKSRYGENRDLWRLDEAANAGDTNARLRLETWHDIKKTLAGRTPLSPEQSKALGMLPPSVQDDIIKQVSDIEIELEDREIKRGTQTRLGELAEYTKQRTGAYVKRMEELGTGKDKYAETVNKLRHSDYQDWGKAVKKLQSDVDSLKSKVQKKFTQFYLADEREKKAAYYMEYTSMKEELDAKEKELGKLAENMPEARKNVDQLEMTPEDEKRFWLMLSDEENQNKSMDELINEFARTLQEREY